MSPGSGGVPSGKLADKINEQFGSLDNFKQEFNKVQALQPLSRADLVVPGCGWALRLRLGVVSASGVNTTVGDSAS